MSDKVYVHATLTIRIGQYERFCEGMAKQKPVLESFGWRMVAAFNTALGKVYNVVHIWELPDANTFFEATAKWRASPGFAEFRAISKEVIEAEMVTMVKKTPYCPELP